jgi:hypothetical protein
MTETQQVTLADFLLARIAEDESLAKKASGDWLIFGDRPRWAKLGFEAGDLAETFYWKRVLAECESKRQIVAWCTKRKMISVGMLDTDPSDPANFIPGDYAHATDVPVLRMLALAYADHPNYRSEWAA